MKKVGELTSKSSGSKLPIVMEENRSFLDWSSVVGKEEFVRIDWKVSDCKTMLEAWVDTNDGEIQINGFVKPTEGFLLDVLNAKINTKKQENIFFQNFNA